MSQPQPATLRLFGGEQGPLPGMDRGLRILPPDEPDTHPPLAVVLPGPGQLSLGANQMLLWDADPEPRQPSLLPDPAPWELAPPRVPVRQARPGADDHEAARQDQPRLFP